MCPTFPNIFFFIIAFLVLFLSCVFVRSTARGSAWLSCVQHSPTFFFHYRVLGFVLARGSAWLSCVQHFPTFFFFTIAFLVLFLPEGARELDSSKGRVASERSVSPPRSVRSKHSSFRGQSAPSGWEGGASASPRPTSSSSSPSCPALVEFTGTASKLASYLVLVTVHTQVGGGGG